MIDPSFSERQVIHIELLIGALIVFLYVDVKLIINGSSYTTVPDRLPILGRQVYLSQFQPVG